ncbi:trypsin-like peptidase domain-containing protein [Actinoallomurus sp. CA-150999]|uniref:trypsin-like serine peptidase n=1 Tax=Actinoallomurus sp. CA-150999 TaxID=3239887 RepID=UPI003D8AE51E
MSTIGALLGTLGTGAPGPAPGVAGVTDHVIAAKRSAILRYWTVRRMLRAVTPPDRPRRRPPVGPPPASPPVTAAVGAPAGSPFGAAGRRATAPAPRPHTTATDGQATTATPDRQSATTATPNRHTATAPDRHIATRPIPRSAATMTVLRPAATAPVRGTTGTLDQLAITMTIPHPYAATAPDRHTAATTALRPHAVTTAIPHSAATTTILRPAPTAPGRNTNGDPGWQGAAMTDRRAVDTADRRTVHGAPGSPWSSSGAVRATTGKVFFTINGGDYVCSAGTIAGANRDLVITAGHCVQDAAGAWARNWLYVPGYDQGRRPYGAFTARHLFVPTAWSGRHDENNDVAIVALAAAGARHVADVVGAQTVAFDQPRGAVVYGFGYPTGGHYDGERLAYCSGRTYPDRHRLTQDQGLRCDMSEGASGGPWLAGFDPVTGRGVVTSVNSFKYSDDPATMYGPYFDAAVRRVYEQAQHS